MAAWWILVLAGGRDPSLNIRSSFVRVCVLLRKTRWRRLPEDEIRFSPRLALVPVVHLASSMDVRKCGSNGVWWICSDLFVVRLYLCVFRLNPSDL